MRHSFFSSLALMLVAASGTCAVPVADDPVRAGSEYELLRADLTRTRITLRSLTATELVARDSKGSAMRLPLSDVVALLPIDQAMGVSVEQLGTVRTTRDRSEQGWLVLRDGQTLPGVIDDSMVSTNTDALPWRTTRFGSLAFSLEDVSLVRFVDAAQASQLRNQRDDMVLLTNADRLTGFVSLTTNAALSVETGPGKQVTTPLARVAAIAFANPAQDREGSWLWLADGTAMRVSSVSLSDSREVTLTLASAARDTSYTVSAEQMLALTPAHERVTGLAALGAPTFTASSSRRWTSAPIIGSADQSPLGAAQIELPGPMSATWQLPAGTSRFASDVELPESCRVWGDCSVVLAIDGKELSRVRLTSQQPAASLAAAIPANAQTLTLTLDAGERGSVEDRVVLSRAMLLTK